MAYDDTDDQFASELSERENSSISMVEAWIVAAKSVHEQKHQKKITEDDCLSIKHKVIKGFFLVSSQRSWPKDADLIKEIKGKNADTNQSVFSALGIVKALYDDPLHFKPKVEIIPAINAGIDQLKPVA